MVDTWTTGVAAVPRRSGEAGHVGHHPAAGTHDEVVAGQTHRGETAQELLEGGQRLAVLSFPDLEHLDASIAEQGCEVTESGGDRGLGDDGDPADTLGHESPELPDGLLADEHRVRGTGDRDGHAQHRNTACVTSPTDRWSTETIASATSL